MSFCSNCGQKLDCNTNFCSKCGYEIKENSIIDFKMVNRKIKNEKHGKVTDKQAVAIALICMILPCVILIMASLVSGNAFDFGDGTIKVGVSSDNLKGQHYEDVVDLLTKNGFEDITVRQTNNNIFVKESTVKYVTIDGEETFYSFSRYNKDAKVVVWYYGKTATE